MYDKKRFGLLWGPPDQEPRSPPPAPKVPTKNVWYIDLRLPSGTWAIFDGPFSEEDERDMEYLDRQFEKACKQKGADRIRKRSVEVPDS